MNSGSNLFTLNLKLTFNFKGVSTVLYIIASTRKYYDCVGLQIEDIIFILFNGVLDFHTPV